MAMEIKRQLVDRCGRFYI